MSKSKVKKVDAKKAEAKKIRAFKRVGIIRSERDIGKIIHAVVKECGKGEVSKKVRGIIAAICTTDIHSRLKTSTLGSKRPNDTVWQVHDDVYYTFSDAYECVNEIQAKVTFALSDADKLFRDADKKTAAANGKAIAAVNAAGLPKPKDDTPRFVIASRAKDGSIAWYYTEKTVNGKKSGNVTRFLASAMKFKAAHVKTAEGYCNFINSVRRKDKTFKAVKRDFALVKCDD